MVFWKMDRSFLGFFGIYMLELPPTQDATARGIFEGLGWDPPPRN